jgi:hypothetical protein
VVCSGFDYQISGDLGTGQFETNDNTLMNRTYMLKNIGGCSWYGEHNALVISDDPGPNPTPPWPITLGLSDEGDAGIGILVTIYGPDAFFAAPMFQFGTILDRPIDCCHLNVTIDKNSTPGPVIVTMPPGGSLFGKCFATPNPNVCPAFPDNDPPLTNNDGVKAVIRAVS